MPEVDSYGLEGFIGDCRRIAAGCQEPSDCVMAILPLMERLIAGDLEFIRPEHLLSDPEHYRRNAVYISPDGSLSLFVLVWLPGQWTPVHDHGSWGVVGVLQGLLEERSFMSVDGEISANEGIRLRRGGVFVLPQKSLSSFVPNPDHIHMTGVPETRPRAVTLHLYGRNMNSFHVYDVEKGTRCLIDVAHHEA